jgi:lipid-A-disaccharide synthase
MSGNKLFVLCGEPSGDLHGSNLVTALISLDPSLEIKCWGGDRMAAAGAQVTKHIDELAFMGFVEFIANLGTILRNFERCKDEISAFRPDLVVLIDYPGFNLRMAKHIKKLGIPVAYYISPQIWAWKESRVERIKKFIDYVFVILPFEQKFYEKHGVQAEFVGHPLLDEINQIDVDPQAFRTKHGLSEKAIVSLLPGSRRQEISLILPPIAQIIEDFPTHQFVVSKVPWQSKELYEVLPSQVKIVEGDTYALLSVSEAAVVASGTATLETALIGTPQVVVYKANPLSVIIARWLVKIKFISLVNLIVDKEVVTELIQGEVKSARLKKELEAILVGGQKRSQVLDDYRALKEKLGAKGASALVANRLLKIIAATS